MYTAENSKEDFEN